MLEEKWVKQAVNRNLFFVEGVLGSKEIEERSLGSTRVWKRGVSQEMEVKIIITTG